MLFYLRHCHHKNFWCCAQLEFSKYLALERMFVNMLEIFFQYLSSRSALTCTMAGCIGSTFAMHIRNGFRLRHKWFLPTILPVWNEMTNHRTENFKCVLYLRLVLPREIENKSFDLKWVAVPGHWQTAFIVCLQAGNDCLANKSRASNKSTLIELVDLLAHCFQSRISKQMPILLWHHAWPVIQHGNLLTSSPCLFCF